MRFKHILLYLLLMSLAATASAQDAAGTSGQDLKAPEKPAEIDEGSTIEKASLLIGYNTISRLKQQNAEFDFAKILEGMKAANEDGDLGMSPEEQQSVLKSYQTLVRRRIMEKQKTEAESNRIEGEQAFEEFSKQEGAQELEDGVMYVVVEEGDGPLPEAPDRVKINYVGTYADGEVFDSSIDKGQPLENGVLQFVPGFSQALQKMKVGGKWKVIIRGDKAYGMKPRPPMEYNKTLLFEIELLEILDPR